MRPAQLHADANPLPLRNRPAECGGQTGRDEESVRHDGLADGPGLAVGNRPLAGANPPTGVALVTPQEKALERRPRGSLEHYLHAVCRTVEIYFSQIDRGQGMDLRVALAILPMDTARLMLSFGQPGSKRKSSLHCGRSWNCCRGRQ